MDSNQSSLAKACLNEEGSILNSSLVILMYALGCKTFIFNRVSIWWVIGHIVLDCVIIGWVLTIKDWTIDWGWQEDDGRIDSGSKTGIKPKVWTRGMDTKDSKSSDGEPEEFKVCDEGIDDTRAWEEAISRKLLVSYWLEETQVVNHMTFC